MLDPAKRQRLIDRLLRAAEDLEAELDQAPTAGLEECHISSQAKAFVDDCMAILDEGLTAEEVMARQERIKRFKRVVRNRGTAKEVRARQEHYKKVMTAGLSEETYAMWLRIAEPKFARELGASEDSPDADAP
jgi:hypothetical protein